MLIQWSGMRKGYVNEYFAFDYGRRERPRCYPERVEASQELFRAFEQGFEGPDRYDPRAMSVPLERHFHRALQIGDEGTKLDSLYDLGYLVEVFYGGVCCLIRHSERCIRENFVALPICDRHNVFGFEIRDFGRLAMVTRAAAIVQAEAQATVLNPICTRESGKVPVTPSALVYAIRRAVRRELVSKDYPPFERFLNVAMSGIFLQGSVVMLEENW